MILIHVDNLGKTMSDDVLECFLEEQSPREKSNNLYRDAAAYFADIVYPVVLHKVCNLSDETDFHVICEYDGYETTVSDNTNNVKTYKTPELDLLNRFLSETDIEISVEWDSEKNDIFDVDGYLMSVDDEELNTNALVYVNAKIPSDKVLAKKTIKALHQEIICVLVHEFRHAIQKIMWGWTHEDGDTLIEHITSKSEIDARVEEILSTFQNASKVSPDEFESATIRYTKKYLLRNAKDLSLQDFNTLFDKMLFLHKDYFKRRQNVAYIEEPK